MTRCPVCRCHLGAGLLEYEGPAVSTPPHPPCGGNGRNLPAPPPPSEKQPWPPLCGRPISGQRTVWCPPASPSGCIMISGPPKVPLVPLLRPQAHRLPQNLPPKRGSPASHPKNIEYIGQFFEAKKKSKMHKPPSPHKPPPKK